MAKVLKALELTISEIPYSILWKHIFAYAYFHS